MMQGKVVGIYIAGEAEAPMTFVAEAELEAGRGIVGDRYCTGHGTFSDRLKETRDWEVTLVESEQIARFNRESGLSINDGQLRRNIVTSGIDLNALPGRRFKVGEVTLEGIRLCEPCAHIAQLVAKEVLEKMVHRAGLRAMIITGGTVRVADSVHAS